MLWMKKGPQTKPDKFREGLHGKPYKCKRPKVTTKDDLNMKIPN